MELNALDYGLAQVQTADFSEYARICGGRGFTINDASKLEEVLGLALRSAEPSIVQINTAAPVFPGLVSQLTRENRSKKEGYLTWV
jgi:thiamine pyrophosphate-dependent acetolactate synthase large subunit-like protein